MTRTARSPEWAGEFCLSVRSAEPPRSALLWRSAGDYANHIRYVARWLTLVAPVAFVIGSAVALFLWALDVMTRTRWAHPWLLWLLPVGGMAIGALYHLWGKSAEAGNNLIVEEIHEPGGGVPGRMAPLILVGTLATHLFGGSAGREGTAVQMGGSLASTLERVLFSRLPGWFQLDDDERRELLQAGVAAGFGAVFGTPITGAVFALEVLAIGRLTYVALIPCLIAALIGDWVTGAWGIHHTVYPRLSLDALGVSHLDPLLLGKVAVAAAAFGLASTLFAELTHGLGRTFRKLVRRPWLRPALGAVIVIGLTLALGTRDYLGLGVSSPDAGGVSILSSFRAGGAAPGSWALKLLFTAVTLASGFKGGEVTPLFFIGAALGNALAVGLHAPVALFAALGFVAVFAGATNTPLACTIMGIELFGADAAIYIATACFLAYLFSGHSGIYLSQRVATPKGDTTAALSPTFAGAALRQLRGAPTPAASRSIPSTPFASSLSLGVAVSHDRPHHSVLPLEGHQPAQHAHHLHAQHHASPLHSGHNALHQQHAPHWPSRPVGLARIYLSPRDRTVAQGWWGKIFAPALSTSIVLAAKRAGIPHALVLSTRYGFTAGGPVRDDHPEYGAIALTCCVELMGDPADIQRFCADHLDLLAGRAVVFRHAESWELPANIASSNDAATTAVSA